MISPNSDVCNERNVKGNETSLFLCSVLSGIVVLK
uniref:Uncharacterized protein n=1 Tax=Anguilla anguilla TaxID=7936 RepID=A0A0E9TJJ4_ANGAN